MGEYRYVAEDEWGAGRRDGRPGDPGGALDRLQQALASTFHELIGDAGL
jgi:hypothetical protein